MFCSDTVETERDHQFYPIIILIEMMSEMYAFCNLKNCNRFSQLQQVYINMTTELKLYCTTDPLPESQAEIVSLCSIGANAFSVFNAAF
jgi:hypothetical protein